MCVNLKIYIILQRTANTTVEMHFTTPKVGAYVAQYSDVKHCITATRYTVHILTILTKKINSIIKGIKR